MKRAPNFKRFSLIERDELDRLQAKQIRDYSPVLSQLVTIKNEIERVLRAPKLGSDERVKVVHLLRTRFDNIYKTLKYNGMAVLPPVPAGAQPLVPGAQVIAAPGAIQQAALPHIGAEPLQMLPGAEQVHDAAPPFEMHAGEQAAPNIEAEGEFGRPEAIRQRERVDVSVGGDEPIYEEREQEMGTEPQVQWPSKQELGIPPNIEPKYKKMTTKLSGYPHLINRNERNEIILNGERIPDSNFSDLIGSLYRRKAQMNLKGEGDFIRMLRELNISPAEISTQESKELLSPSEFQDAPSSPQHGTGRNTKKSVPFKSPISSSKKLGPPPGKRPRILRVYQ